MTIALPLSDSPAESAREQTTGDDLLLALAREHGVRHAYLRYPQGNGRTRDASSPVIAVDHSACILCDRCIRACDEIQHNDVIGRTGKGYTARIAFDLDSPMGKSTCVACGECASVCPTGALTHKPLTAPIRPRGGLRCPRRGRPPATSRATAADGSPAAWWTMPRCSPPSARPPGTRPSTWWPAG